PVATASGLDGTYLLRLPGPGPYTLKASLPGFAEGSRALVLESGSCRATADLDLPLQSRAAAAAPPATRPPVSMAGGRAQRFRDLALAADAAGAGQIEGPDAASQSLLPPGASPDAPTESVALAASGNAAQTVDALLYGDRQAWLDEAGGDLEALGRRIAQA